jgi:diaminohydroxyphosphoribosylaminopyrimidine deaminase / 5-amino-6-(5-phosphoribosylamino)uracil reductase
VNDIESMNRALELAARGRGRVEPNPMVGAILVTDGKIVGEGWHEQFGQAHAEINALRQAGDRAKGADLFVTLEPCCHFGKTPPCTEAVIAAGVRRVVAAMLDPFPRVAGRGASILKEAGIAFEVGVGEVVARELNAPYLKRLRAGRPFVHAKWAMTLDGKIATHTGESKWITGEKARAKVHELRGLMDAIVVGAGTLRADDPLLTARPKGPRTPTRVVVCTGTNPLPKTCKLLETLDEAPVLFFFPRSQWQIGEIWRKRGADVHYLQGDDFHYTKIGELLDELGKRNMTNILVEGGSTLLGRFLDEGEVDEVHAFVAPKIVGGREAPGPIGAYGIGQIADALKLKSPEIHLLDSDLYIRGRVESMKGERDE